MARPNTRAFTAIQSPALAAGRELTSRIRLVKDTVVHNAIFELAVAATREAKLLCKNSARDEIAGGRRATRMDHNCTAVTTMMACRYRPDFSFVVVFMSTVCEPDPAAPDSESSSFTVSAPFRAAAPRGSVTSSKPSGIMYKPTDTNLLGLLRR